MRLLLLIVAALILPMAVLAIALVIAAILRAITAVPFAAPRIVRVRSNVQRALLPLRAPPVLLA